MRQNRDPLLRSHWSDGTETARSDHREDRLTIPRTEARDTAPTGLPEETSPDRDRPAVDRRVWGRDIQVPPRETTEVPVQVAEARRGSALTGELEGLTLLPAHRALDSTECLSAGTLLHGYSLGHRRTAIAAWERKLLVHTRPDSSPWYIHLDVSNHY